MGGTGDLREQLLGDPLRAVGIAQRGACQRVGDGRPEQRCDVSGGRFCGEALSADEI